MEALSLSHLLSMLFSSIQQSYHLSAESHPIQDILHLTHDSKLLVMCRLRSKKTQLAPIQKSPIPQR